MAKKINSTQDTRKSQPSNGVKAVLKNYRQSPRKTRLIADLVRGKKVREALDTLHFVNKKAAGPFTKVIRSAAANAKQQGKNGEELVIKKIVVDKGNVYRRFMPRARGAASPINRRNSHIVVELEETNSKTSNKSNIKS